MLECSICTCEFDIELEGGVEGWIGMIPCCLCPTCMAGLADLFRQIADEGLQTPN